VEENPDFTSVRFLTVSSAGKGNIGGDLGAIGENGQRQMAFVPQSQVATMLAAYSQTRFLSSF
jgi:hypothetical protein